ncbi:MAG TPA: amidase family protein [Clostridia bacterium]|nr:amidase family protein [Clostridia bacterium]
MALYELTIHEARELIDGGEISVEGLTESIIHRIENIGSNMDAFVSLNVENSLKDARIADGLLSRGKKLSTLGGIPFGVQDNICTKDLKTSCGSRMLYNFIPPYDASIVRKLRDNHSIIIGKINMDEFGIGYTSGLAAGVATGQAFYGLGSDIAGYLRQSAASAGLVGFKPTYGLVSRFGLVSCASSLEQIGFITKDVRDCADVLDEIAFYDDRDPASYKLRKPSYNQSLTSEVKGLKIGLPKEVFNENWDPDIRSAVEAALKTYEGLGAEIVDIDIPHAKYAPSAHYIITSGEASSNLARYDGIRYGFRAQESENLEMAYKKTRTEGFGDEVKKRIMLGNLFLTSEYYHSHYIKALKVKTLLKEDFRKAYEKCNVIFTPTSPGLALEHEDSQRYTLLANIVGLPAISIPCGFNEDTGSHVGMQLIGNLFREDTLIRVANTFQLVGSLTLEAPWNRR